MKFKLSVAVVVLAALSACKKNDPEPDAAKLLLTEVRVDRGQNPELAFQLDYDKDKVIELREFDRNTTLKRFTAFSFNSKGIITSFVERKQSIQGNPVFLEHRIRFDGDNLFDVQVIDNSNTANPKVVNRFGFDSDQGIAVIVSDETGKSIRQRRADYDNTGNMIRMITRSLPAGKPDTLDFSNYDNNPNSLALIDGIIGRNDFLPSSKNNPRKIIQRIEGRQPLTQEFTYEYNDQGFPVKIISDRQTILLEYNKAE
jgi:hypothetical protein